MVYTRTVSQRLLRFCCAVAVCAALLEPLIFAGSFAGDAQVHLVFGETASHGRFFEFNPGERVSGETSPGYMLVEALLFVAFPAHVVPVAVKALNLAVWYMFCVLVYRVARRVLDEDDDGGRAWAAGAAIVAAFIPGSVYNANVGMENGLFAATVWWWIDLAQSWGWFQFRSVIRRSHLLGLSALLGAACWLRPEAWLVGAVFFTFRLIVARPPVLRWLIAAGVFVLLGAGAIAFQYAFTSDVIATSILSRRVLAMKDQLSIGPLTVDPNFTKRLVVYAPLTLFGVFGLQGGWKTQTPALKCLTVLFLSFFVFYTLFGAPQIGRYVIFLLPILAIGAARGGRILWRRSGRRGWTVIVTAGVAFAAIGTKELAVRRATYSQRLLAIAMHAPVDRQGRTTALLQRLGNPSRLPVVLAEEPIQQRYELDERIVVRSLDGRTDRALLSFVKDGKVDHLGYLRHIHADFLLSPVDYDRGPAPGVLAHLKSLAPDSQQARGHLLFRRLPSGVFKVNDLQRLPAATGLE